MDRSELQELHYIAPIGNVPSILELGLLSHRAASRVQHDSIAMTEIQDRRRKVQVPAGLALHEYVNLYFNARNPMMYKRRADHASITVLRVGLQVLDLPGVVLASGNASSEYTRFAASPGGLAMLDSGLVFAKSWLSADEIDYFRRKSAICAEVLVPARVGPEHVQGAYVSCPEAEADLEGRAPGLALEVRPELFFW